MRRNWTFDPVAIHHGKYQYAHGTLKNDLRPISGFLEVYGRSLADVVKDWKESEQEQ